MNMLGTRVMANQLKTQLENLIIVITDSFAIAPYYIGLVMEAPPPELSPVVSTNQTNLPGYRYKNDIDMKGFAMIIYLCYSAPEYFHKQNITLFAHIISKKPHI